jgi:hypothetical protein
MSSAIRDTSETLLELLRTELATIVQPQQIALLSPAEAGLAGGVRLTLFLYAAAPAAELRNELEIPGARDNDAPVSEPLELYYLLSAFPSPITPVPSERTLDSQLLLGHAMRVFFDNGTLSGSMLRGELLRQADELRLTFQPMTTEDLTRLWSVLPNTALQPSVSYVVSPVRLRSTRTRGGHPVVSRDSVVDQVVPGVTE